MATTVAPLYAQDQPATAPTGTAVETPTATVSNQSAAKLGALALLPKDAANFLVLPDVGGNLARMGGGCGIPAELQAIDVIALADTAASGSSLAATAKFLSFICGTELASHFFDDWAKGASEAARGVLKQAQDPRFLDQKLIAAIKDFVPSVKVTPQYVVVTCKPGSENVLEGAYKHAVERLAEEASLPDDPLDKVEVNGFTGVRLDLAKALKDEEGEVNAALRETLDGRGLYVMLRLQGNALVGVLCENPEEISLAATPADSLQASDAVAEAAPALEKNLLALLRVSPELQAVSNASTSAKTAQELASAISGIFDQLAEKDAAHQPAYAKASAGVKALAAQYAALLPDISQPATLQIWSDENLHAVFTCDAMGVSYKTAPLKHAALADAPDTCLYVESTPLDLGATQLPSCKVALSAALDVAKGMAETFDGPGREGALFSLQGVERFLPELNSLASATGTIASGLDGSWTVLMDSVPGPLPFGGDAKATVNIPRLSIAAGVADRSKLGDGWNALVKTAGQVIGKLGGDPACVGMLPIVPANAGAATTYKVALPFFTPDFVPSLAVSDSTLAIGTSDKLNAQLATTATGSATFAGTVCTIRFEPLAKCLGSLADAMEPDEGPAAGPAPCDAPGAKPGEPNAKGEDCNCEEACDCGCGREDDFDAVAPAPPAMRPMGDLRCLAGQVGELAKEVESVSCTCTIENGKLIIKADVKLK